MSSRLVEQWKQEDAAQALSGNTGSGVRMVLAGSRGLGAAQAARALGLAVELGVSEKVVIANPHEAEEESRARRIAKSDTLGRFAEEDIINAALAKDDPNLGDTLNYAADIASVIEAGGKIRPHLEQLKNRADSFIENSINASAAAWDRGEAQRRVSSNGNLYLNALESGNMAEAEKHLSDALAAQKQANPYALQEAFGLIEPGEPDIGVNPHVCRVDERWVLLPSTDEAGNLIDEEAAARQFLQTGRHGGIFNDRDKAELFARQPPERQTEIFKEFTPRSDSWIDRSLFGGAIEQLPRIFCDQLPTQLSMAVTTALTGAGTGAVTGAGIGAGVGALAAGVGAVPGTVGGAVQGAVTGFRVGAWAGWNLGAGVAAMQAETGAFAVELAQERDLDGNSLAPETIVAGAKVYGMLAAAVETVGEAMFLKLLKSFGVVDSLGINRFLKGAVKEAVRDKSRAAAILNMCTRFAGNMGMEGLEEMVQEGLGILIGFAAKGYNNAEHGTDFSQEWTDAETSRIWKAGIEGALVGSWINGGPILILGAMDVHRAGEAKEYSDALLALHEKVDACTTRQLAPDRMQVALEKAGSVMREMVDLPADAMMELYQNGADLIAPLGLDAAEVQKAADMGQALHLPVSRMLVRLDRAQMKEAARIVQRGENSLSVAEAEKLDISLQMDAERLTALYQQNEQAFSRVEEERQRLRGEATAAIKGTYGLADQASGELDAYVDDWLNTVEAYSLRMGGVENAAQIMGRITLDSMRAAGSQAYPLEPQEGADSLAGPGGALMQTAMYSAKDASLGEFATRVRKEGAKASKSFFPVSVSDELAGIEFRLPSDTILHQVKRHPDMSLEDWEKLPEMLAQLNSANTAATGKYGQYGASFIGTANIAGTAYGISFSLAQNGTVYINTFFKDNPNRIKKWVQSEKEKASKGREDEASATALESRFTLGKLSELNLRQLLESVKDSLGNAYSQPARPGSPHRFDQFSGEPGAAGLEETPDARLARDLAAWEKTVDAFMAGILDKRKPVTMLNNTPLVLTLLGADKALKVNTSYGVLKKVLVEKHRLPESVLKQVPQAITDPVMIFDSATVKGDYVMMLDLKDENGATVIAPVSLNYDSTGGYTVNYVPSVYVKADAETGKPNNEWFKKQIEEGRLQYVNHKKSREWATSSGLQLPRVGSHPSNGKKTIFTEADLVKLKAQFPTYYQSGVSYPGEKARLAADVAAWSAEVDRIAASGRTPSNPVQMLVQTPLVMQLIGTDSITGRAATEGGIYAAPHLFDGSHPNITLEMLRQIPAAMADPIAIFDSDSPAARAQGDIVFMLELTDAHGATVVVPVTLAASGKAGAIINIAKSAYAKEKQGNPSDSWFEKQVNKNARYLNGQKWALWTSARGSDSPLVAHNASSNTIYTEADLGKLKARYSGMYQSAGRAAPAESRAPVLRGDELGVPEGADIREYRKAAREVYRRLQSTPAYRADLGEIRFTRAGWDEAAYTGADPRKWKLFPRLKELVENAEYIQRADLDKPRKDKIIAFHWLEADVILEGKALRIGINVAEDVDGNKFYSLNQDLNGWTEKYKAPDNRSGKSKPGAQELMQDVNTSVAESVEQAGDNVNLHILPRPASPAPQGGRQTAQSPDEAFASGAAAMERVITEQTDALDAMFRPDVGSISFYWGNPGKGPKFRGGSGVSHLIAHGNAQGLDGEAIARKMAEVLAYGEISGRQNTPGGNSVFISYRGHTAVLSLYRFGNRETWLLTGWQNGKTPDAQTEVYDSASAASDGAARFRPDDGAGDIENSLPPLGADGKPLFHNVPNAPQGGKMRGGLSISPDNQYIITLFKDADLSTLLHETGHIFLEELERLVDDGLADAGMQADYAALKKWFARFADEAVLKNEYNGRIRGLPGFDGRAFEALNGEERAEARRIAEKEYFARGFEKYLLEGRAPARELEGAFARFRKWLLRIYTEAARALGVELNPEVRAVFDRMLLAEARAQYQTSAAAAGERSALIGKNAVLRPFFPEESAGSHPGQEKQGGRKTPPVLYQFIGEIGAANLDRAEGNSERMDELKRAVSMEEEGKSVRDIKYNTGWERGADGKWRYEIVDVLLEPPSAEDLEKANTALGKKAAGSLKSGRAGEAKAGKRGAGVQKTERRYRENIFNVLTGKAFFAEAPLEYWIDNPTLFNAYPQLRELPVEVRYNKGGDGVSGKFEPGSPHIYITVSELGDASKVLLHEMQHAIQNIEGFAGGGSPWHPRFAGMSPEQAHFNYRRLPGEVEARNVEIRMYMDADERRASPAFETEDIARKDQISIDDYLPAAGPGNGAGLFSGGWGAKGRAAFYFPAAGDVYPVAYLSSLFRDADLSTLLHETGHIFLEELGRTVESGAADAAMRRDCEMLCDWLGAQPGERLNRQQRRQAARAFEAYLLEGRVPGRELAGAFARFKKWLLEIYHSAARQNVQLTDEVRGVFGRMLAAGQEVAMQAAQHGFFDLTPLEMEKLGIVGAEADNLRRLVEKAREKAGEALQNARNADWIARQAKFREKALLKLGEERVYKTRRAMRQTPLDAEMVREEFGGEFTAELLKKLPASLKKGGADPFVFARQQGWASLVEMLAEVKNAPKLDEAVKAKIEIYNAEDDARFEASEYLLETEELALQRDAVGRRLAEKLGYRHLERQVYTDAARRAAFPMPMERALQTGSFLGAMRRAMQREREAGGRGDWEAALNAHHKAMLNMELARLSRQIRRKKEDLEARIKRFVEMKEADPDARFLVMDLGMRHGLCRFSSRLARGRDMGKWRSWVKDAENEGFNIYLDDRLSSGPGQLWQVMRAAEFETLAQAVKQIVAVERGRRTISDGQRERDFEEVKNEIVKSVDAGGRRVELNPAWEAGAIGHMLRREGNCLTEVEVLCRRLDGDIAGPLWRYIYKRVADAEDARGRRAEQERLRQMELYAVYDRHELRRLPREKLVIKALGSRAITRENMLAVALNLGNETNRQRLLSGKSALGENVSEAALEEILGHMTEKDCRFVQSVWDYLDSFREEIFGLQEKINGLPPDRVEAKPFALRLKDGSIFEFRGGFYPVACQCKSGAGRREEEEQLKQDIFGDGFGAAAITQKGHSKACTESHGAPLLLNLSVIQRHVHNLITDLTMREALIDTVRLVRNREIGAAFTRSFGVDACNLFMPWLRDVARQCQADAGREKIAAWMRGGLAVMDSAPEADAGMLQTDRLGKGAGRLGWKWVIRGLREIYGAGVHDNPFAAANRLLNAWERACSVSPFMVGRMHSRIREMQELYREFLQGDSSDVARRHACDLISYVQLYTVDLPLFAGAYLRAAAEGKSQAAAAAYAESIVRLTQSSGKLSSPAEGQHNGGFWKLSSAFYNWFSAIAGLAARTETETEPAKPETLKRAAGFLFSAWIGSQTMEVFLGRLRGRWPDDNGGRGAEEEWLKYLAGKNAGFWPGMLPLPDNAKQGTKRGEINLPGTGRGIESATSALNNIIRLLEDSEKGPQNSALKETATNGLRAEEGSLPSEPAAQILKTIWEYMEGSTPELEIRRALFRQDARRKRADDSA